ncbi:MAG: IS1380 family transposase [Rhodobacteraceae bacterium]|nr:IS1380 family transposase [Paracoccaceae bacterium]
MDEDTPVLPGLSPVQGLGVCARFDGGALSSDGGVLLLRQIERSLGFAETLAGCLRDGRDAGRTRHSYSSMIRSRMLAIACGYEDCDDLDELRHDPAFKLACERLPDTGPALASQPTLSRLENTPSWRELARMGLALIDLFCASFAAVPGHIVLDIDDTADRVHGGQQLSLFNSHAGGYCFQPIHIYEATSQKPVCFILRPGKRPSGEEAAQVLRHVIRRIRRNWPQVAITLRGDGHYGTPEVMDLLEQQGCFYVLGLPGNEVLKKLSHPWCDDVATRRAQAGRQKLRRFFQASYGAKSWSKARRVIARVEATALGSDVRYIVTNMPGRAKHLYEKVYCARGKAENLIKEHKLYTKSDRTSCHRWQANQFRLFLHTGAYWLLLRLRKAAPKRSKWRAATFETIRRAFLKIAVRIEQLKTRIKIALPSACPEQKMFALLAASINAQSP